MPPEGDSHNPPPSTLGPAQRAVHSAMRIAAAAAVEAQTLGDTTREGYALSLLQTLEAALDEAAYQAFVQRGLDGETLRQHLEFKRAYADNLVHEHTRAIPEPERTEPEQERTQPIQERNEHEQDHTGPARDFPTDAEAYRAGLQVEYLERLQNAQDQARLAAQEGRTKDVADWKGRILELAHAFVRDQNRTPIIEPPQRDNLERAQDMGRNGVYGRDVAPGQELTPQQEQGIARQEERLRAGEPEIVTTSRTVRFGSPEHRRSTEQALIALGIQPELIAIRLLADMDEAKPAVEAVRRPTRETDPNIPGVERTERDIGVWRDPS